MALRYGFVDFHSAIGLMGILGVMPFGIGTAIWSEIHVHLLWS